jgi:hypothetical protein
MISLPGRVLSAGTALVAASTVALPWITGYGTVLYLNVVLSAWGVVAAAASGKYADLHHGPVWFVAFLLNIGAFLVPGLAIFYSTRRRWPRLSAIGLLAWTAFYLMSLFVLFPATDGP